MKRRLRAEWPRALVALVLATGLWFVVSAEEPASQWVNVRLSLSLDPDVSLAEPAAPVQALIAGKRRDLYKLISSPPTMRRAVTAEGSDSVRLELRAQDVDLPEGSDAVVRDLRPRLLLVSLIRPAPTAPDSVSPP